jgi:hypothetical protein
MVVATVRRIEFPVCDIGVLTVHSGIVVITLGSVYYGGAQAGGRDAAAGRAAFGTGEMSPGPWQSIFYDAQRTSLYGPGAAARTGCRCPARGLPRYNDYGLNVKPGPSAWDLSGAAVPGSDRALALNVPPPPQGSLIEDLRFRVVGYAQHTEERARVDWLKSEPRPGEAPNPLREIRLAIPGQARDAGHAGEGLSFYFLPTRPRERLTELDELGLEYVWGRPARADRGSLNRDRRGCAARGGGGSAPGGAALAGARGRAPGEGGWHATRRAGADRRHGVHGGTGRGAEPPGPANHHQGGNEGAQSSLLKLRVVSPSGERFVRWVYHRFPELAQDLLDDQTADGRPVRREATPAIRVGYVDASKWQVYVVEDPASGGGADPCARAR